MRYLKGVLGLIGAVLMMAPQTSSAQQALLEPVQYGGGSVLCRIGPDAANRFRGGQRDCYTSNVRRDGICYCPSGAGPLEGDVVRGRGYGGGYGGGYYEPPRRSVGVVCRIPPSAAVFTGGRRDCAYQGGPGGSCYCPSDRGPIRGVAVQVR